MAVVVWIYTKGSRDRSGVGRTFIPVETVYTPAVVADLDTLGLLPVGSSALATMMDTLKASVERMRDDIRALGNRIQVLEYAVGVRPTQPASFSG